MSDDAKKADDWKVFQNVESPHDVDWSKVETPPWRKYDSATRGAKLRLRVDSDETQGQVDDVVSLVNAAIHLRRPLLVTGTPGTGKSQLAYAIKHELNLDEVLEWPINSRSTRLDGLYQYDAMGRFQDLALAVERAKLDGKLVERSIGEYITLGPLGTALLPTDKPRVVLIDELDKSDADLPNDLLHVLESGSFEIREIVRDTQARRLEVPGNAEPQHVEFVRTADKKREGIVNGFVRCREFPIVVMTSNGERDFSPAFKRRCIRVKMPEPKGKHLERIVEAHFSKETLEKFKPLVEEFVTQRGQDRSIATDQLLNAVRLAMSGAEMAPTGALAKAILRPISGDIE